LVNKYLPINSTANDTTALATATNEDSVGSFIVVVGGVDGIGDTVGVT